MSIENPENNKLFDEFYERMRTLDGDRINDKVDNVTYIQKLKDLLKELKDSTFRDLSAEEKEELIDALERQIEAESWELKNFTDLPDRENLSNNLN